MDWGTSLPTLISRPGKVARWRQKNPPKTGSGKLAERGGRGEEAKVEGKNLPAAFEGKVAHEGLYPRKWGGGSYLNHGWENLL